LEAAAIGELRIKCECMNGKQESLPAKTAAAAAAAATFNQVPAAATAAASLFFSTFA
jgi:hypothetical protein